MRFFKLLLICCAALFVSCASGPVPVSHPEPETTPVEEPIEAPVEEQPIVEPIEDDISPYFKNAKPVNNDIQREFGDGLALQAQGLYQQAYTHWQTMATTYPEYSGIWLNKGLVEVKLEQTENAIKSFQTAIEINPLNQEAYNELAIAMREQGQFDQAKQLYLDSLSVWPKHARTHKNLAILYDLYLHDYAAAIRHFSLYAQYAGVISNDEQNQLRGWMLDLSRRVKQ